MKLQETRGLVVSAAWCLLHRLTCCGSTHSVENTLVTGLARLSLQTRLQAVLDEFKQQEEREKQQVRKLPRCSGRDWGVTWF